MAALTFLRGREQCQLTTQPTRTRASRLYGVCFGLSAPVTVNVRPYARLIVKRISSTWTFFYKKVFPLLWFGFLAFFVVSTILLGAMNADPTFLIGPVLMAVFGFFLMKKLVWDLVDEVYDCGDFLLVKNRREEDRVALSNIMNVNLSTFVNPPRITLRLVNPSKFGQEISFSPITGFSLNPFAKNQVAEDMIVRVDQARSRRAV